MQTRGGNNLSGRRQGPAAADRRATAACALRALSLAAVLGTLFSQTNPAWPAAAPAPDAAAEARRPDIPGWLPPHAPPPRAAPVLARPAQPAAAPRQLLISLRYGSPRETAVSRSVTANSRDTDGDEQHVQVLDGQRALVAGSERSASSARHSAGPPGFAGASGSMIEVQPTLTGNTVLVRLVAQRQTAGPGGSSSGQHIETTLGMALGEWTEVSGRGPWAADPSRDTSSSRDARNDARRVFIRIDEIRR